MNWNAGWMALGNTAWVYPEATVGADTRALWLYGHATAALRVAFAQLLRSAIQDCAQLLLVCDDLMYMSAACLREVCAVQIEIADPASKQIVMVNARSAVIAECKTAAMDQLLPFENLSLPKPPQPVPDSIPSKPTCMPNSPSSAPQAITVLLASNDDTWFGSTEQSKTSVGRHESAEIVIPNEQKSVSRHHLELFNAEDGYHLRDVGSANGTLLDGKPILPKTEVRLHNAHQVSLGNRYACLLLLEPLLVVSLEEYAAFWRARHLLAGLRSSDARILYLTDTPLLLGRQHAIGTLMRSNGISHEHGEITFANDRYYIIDRGSRNGTYINSKEIIPDTPTPLSSGDQLRLGGEQHGETFVWEQRMWNGTSWQEEQE